MEEATEAKKIEARSIGDLSVEVLEKMQRVAYGDKLISSITKSHVLDQRAAALNASGKSAVQVYADHFMTSASIHAIKAMSIGHAAERRRFKTLH
jgi:hypothetical protein